MAWQIERTKKALDDLRALNRKTAQRIVKSVTQLAQVNQGDVKKLQGFDPPMWRLRVGDWRILLIRWKKISLLPLRLSSQIAK